MIGYFILKRWSANFAAVNFGASREISQLARESFAMAGLQKIDWLHSFSSFFSPWFGLIFFLFIFASIFVHICNKELSFFKTTLLVLQSLSLCITGHFPNFSQMPEMTSLYIMSFEKLCFFLTNWLSQALVWVLIRSSTPRTLLQS